VLAARPGILVLDEPTFGQDARTWRELVALSAELLDAGSALVAVTHDAEFVDVLADDVLVLGGPGDAVAAARTSASRAAGALS
jgi:energy-coupling factor transport system ATP-binding protein